MECNKLKRKIEVELGSHWLMNMYNIANSMLAIFIEVHTHSHFMGQPGWAGTRRDIHPLTPETCCGSL